MERAKQAAASFLSKDGKHRTTVDEDIRATVVDEHVRPHQHEEVVTAVDKEVHQDHHHTTIQPLKAQETLAEQHTHNVLPTEHKTYTHGNEEELRATLARDAAKYKDTSVTHGTTHSQSAGASLSGEHIHHHVHEHLQPIVQKEVIAPHVVHTTVPIHETHHAEAVHHGTSTLPVKSIEEFKSAGGVLKGRESATLRTHDGCPPTYNKDLQTERLEADRDMHIGHHHDHEHGHHSGTGTGIGSSSTRSGVGSGIGSGVGMGTGSSNTRSGDRSGVGSGVGSGIGSGVGMGTGNGSDYDRREKSGILGGQSGTSGQSGIPGTSTDHSRSGTQGRSNVSAAAAAVSGATGSHNTRSTTGPSSSENFGTMQSHSRDSTSSTDTGAKKPSLVQKLNPFKDTDGDGKKGVME